MRGVSLGHDFKDKGPSLGVFRLDHRPERPSSGDASEGYLGSQRTGRRKQKSNPRFAFMFGGEGAVYYNYVTAELTRRMAQSAAHGLATAQRKAGEAERTPRQQSSLTTT